MFVDVEDGDGRSLGEERSARVDEVADAGGGVGAEPRDLLMPAVAADADAGAEAVLEVAAEEIERGVGEILIVAGVGPEEVAAIKRGLEPGDGRVAQGRVAVAVHEVVVAVDQVAGEGGSGAGDAAARDFGEGERLVEDVLVVFFRAETGAEDGALREAPRQLRIVDEDGADVADVVAIVGGEQLVLDVIFFVVRIRDERGDAGSGDVHDRGVDVEEDAAAAVAALQIVVQSFRADVLVDLLVDRDEAPEAARKFVAHLGRDRVPAEIGVVHGAAPILVARHDALGGAEARDAQRVDVEHREGGAVVDRRVAESLGGGGAHTVDLAADEGPDRGEAGGGDVESGADAVGLHAGEIRVGVEGVAARAADVGGGVVGEHGVGGAFLVVHALPADVEGGARRELPAEGGGDAVQARAAALARALAVVEKEVEAVGGLLRHEGAHSVDRGAAAAPRIPARGESGRVAAHGGAFGADVDRAAGVDIAVREAAGAAREFDAVGVEHVLRHVPREAVAELAHRRQAAKRDRVAGARADGGAAGGAVVEDVFGADREIGGVEKVEGTEVREEVGGHYRDGVGEVFEFFVGAGAGHGGGGGVAAVVAGADFEDGEFDGFVRGRGGRR